MLNKITSIQVKAGILLFIFSLNMIKGFACTLESVIGFIEHAYCSETTECNSHLTNDDNTSIYNTKNSGKQQNHTHADKEGLQLRSEDCDDDCCTDSVVMFNCLDKNVTQNINASLNGSFFIEIISNCLFFDIFNGPAITSFTYKLPHFHPPAPDIRVFIQSFLI